MAAQSTPWSTGTLLLACSALAAIVGLELGKDLPIAPRVTAAPPVALELPRKEGTRYDPPAPQEFDAIANRPLFSATRRPFVPVAVEEDLPEPAAGPEATGPGIELVGVLLSDSQRAALLAPVGGGQPLWLYEGQAMDGWVIEGIQADRATLRQGKRASVLELRSD
jgi:hypothetical protein